MKTVVTTPMVAHIWATQNQPYATNSTRSFYFSNTTIYSYGGHFPIARFVNKPGVDVLVTTRTFSITTAKHIHTVRSAIRHLRVLTVHNPQAQSTQEHMDNLDKLRKNFYEHVEKAERAIKHSAYSLQQAQKLIQTHASYRAAFGETLDDPLLMNETWLKQANGRVAAQQALQKELDKRKDQKYQDSLANGRVAAQQALQKELDKRKDQKYQDYIAKKRLDLEQWKTDLNFIVGSFNSLPIALRKNGEEIETSLNARIPINHAQFLWKKVQEVRSTQIPYNANGHTLHVGHFTVQSIAIDGTLVAGCHTITFDAMQELATKLSW